MELRGKVSMLSRTSKLLLVVALVAGTLAIAAPAVNSAATYVIKAKSSPDRWGPKLTHAKMQGGKAIVKWKNPSRRRVHDVKSINVGKRWKMSRKVLRPKSANVVTRTFKKGGTYWYRCTIHSALVGGKWTGMVGRVHVFR